MLDFPNFQPRLLLLQSLPKKLSIFLLFLKYGNLYHIPIFGSLLHHKDKFVHLVLDYYIYLSIYLGSYMNVSFYFLKNIPTFDF